MKKAVAEIERRNIAAEVPAALNVVDPDPVAFVAFGYVVVQQRDIDPIARILTGWNRDGERAARIVNALGGHGVYRVRRTVIGVDGDRDGATAAPHTGEQEVFRLAFVSHSIPVRIVRTPVDDRQVGRIQTPSAPAPGSPRTAGRVRAS